MNKVILNISKMFALMVITLCTHLAHANITSNGDTIYTINVGTFAGASLDDFVELRKFGYVYSEDVSGELGRIFLGGFDNKMAAERTLASVQETGFAEATITKTDLKKGKKRFVIQLATKNSIENIDWDSYQQAGDIYTYLKDTYVKIVVGTYETQAIASAQLERIQSLGFKDAFPKEINELQLHAINAFDKGSPTAILAVKPVKKTLELIGEAAPEGDLVGKGGEDMIKLTPKINDPIPSPYDNIFTPKAPKEIRKNKRESVQELQKFLKKAEVFPGKLDGIYGEETGRSLLLFSKNDAFYQRYKVLAKVTDKTIDNQASELETIINSISTNPDTSSEKLKTRSEAIAKAYRAYLAFNPKADHNLETNDLMNEAIQKAFKDFKGEKAPFDHKATYAYKNYNQLILHLSYIQNEKAEAAVPCWLMIKHPKETAEAFKEGFKMQNCGSFLNWENVQILETIASDLNTNEKENTVLDEKIQAEQNKLIVLPEAPSKDKKQEVKAWQEVFWLAMNDWSDEDPFHAKFTTPLKVAYYKTWIELEDFYMDKGFSQPDANVLALSVLQTILEPQLNVYLK